jgi:hypothetical protein
MKTQTKYYTIVLVLLMIFLAINMTKNRSQKITIKQNVDIFGELDLDEEEIHKLPVSLTLKNTLNVSSIRECVESTKHIYNSVVKKGAYVIVIVDKKDLALYSAIVNVIFKLTPKTIIITSDKEDVLSAITFLSKDTPSMVLTFNNGKMLLPHQVSSLYPDPVVISNEINQEKDVLYAPINTALNIRLITAYKGMDMKVINCSIQNADGIVIDNRIDEKIDLQLDDSIKLPIIIVGSTKITKFINEPLLTPEDAIAMLYMHLTRNPPQKPPPQQQLIKPQKNRVKKGLQFR